MSNSEQRIVFKLPEIAEQIVKNSVRQGRTLELPTIANGQHDQVSTFGDLWECKASRHLFPKWRRSFLGLLQPSCLYSVLVEEPRIKD